MSSWDPAHIVEHIEHAIMASPDQLSAPLHDPFPWASVTHHWWLVLGLALVALALLHVADAEAGR